MRVLAPPRVEYISPAMPTYTLESGLQISNVEKDLKPFKQLYTVRVTLSFEHLLNPGESPS